MIYGTGIDLVNIERMERVIRRWGDRFKGRIFTPEEIRICTGRPLPHHAFALRFGAKEAFSKALGLGMRKGLRWRDIEVFNDAAGKPGLKLHGAASRICNEKGINGVHLSLSDDGEYGVAMVVLELSGAVRTAYQTGEEIDAERQRYYDHQCNNGEEGHFLGGSGQDPVRKSYKRGARGG